MNADTRKFSIHMRPISAFICVYLRFPSENFQLLETWATVHGFATDEQNEHG